MHELEQRWLNEKKGRPGLTYDQFGEYFGITGAMVRAVEKGRSSLGLITLAAIRVRYPQWKELVDQYLVEIGQRTVGKELNPRNPA